MRKNTECFNNPQTGKIRNIPWNFSKFLVDENGNIIAYLNPRQSLYSRIDQIEVMVGLKKDGNVELLSNFVDTGPMTTTGKHNLVWRNKS